MSGLSLVLLSCTLALVILSLTLWHCSPRGTRTRQFWHRPALLAIPPLAAVLVGVYEQPALISPTGPLAPLALLALMLPQWWLMRGTFHCRTCSAVYFDPHWGRHIAYRCQVCRGYHAHGQAFAWHRGHGAADPSNRLREEWPDTTFAAMPDEAPGHPELTDAPSTERV